MLMLKKEATKETPVTLCLLLPSRKRLYELAEAFLALTPQIACTSSEHEDAAVFLGFPRMAVAQRVETWVEGIARSFVTSYKGAWGVNPAVALLRARYQRKESLRDLSIYALRDFSDPFTLDHEEVAQVEDLLALLFKLGLKTLDDFYHFPKEALPSHLGKRAVILHQALCGEREYAWPRMVFPERVFEKVDLSDCESLSPYLHLEPIFFLLKKICDRLLYRLRGRGQKIATLDLKFTLEDRSLRLWKINLPLSQSTTAGLLPILHEKLSFDFSQNPLKKPPVSLEVTVTETEPFSGAQRDFFSQKEEEGERLQELLGRLWGKLGKERAFFAHHIPRHLPEGAWEKGDGIDAGENESKGGEKKHLHRPTRLLKRPERIEFDGRFLKGSRKWRPILWEGPERISGEWWRRKSGKSFSRDYYRVFTEEGQELWIFFSREADDFFLHGYFD